MKRLVIILLVLLSQNVNAQEFYEYPISDGQMTDPYPLKILKFNPEDVQMGMYHDETSQMDGKDFVKKLDVLAVVNAGMFHGMWPVGYTKLDGRVVQPNRGGGHRHYAHFGDGYFYILSDSIDQKADNVLNLIRVIADGKIRWSVQPKYWSAVVLGEDYDGNGYFIYSRSGLQVNRLAHYILEAIPNIKEVAYLEGGPETTLSVKDKGDWYGSYETGFYEGDNNNEQWFIPNVIWLRGQVK